MHLGLAHLSLEHPPSSRRFWRVRLEVRAQERRLHEPRSRCQAVSHRRCLMTIAMLAAFAATLAVRQAPAAGASQDYHDQAGVVEKLYQRVRFNDDGTGFRDLSMRVRVQTEAGVQEFGQLAWGYNSANETVKVDSVVIHTASGTVVADSAAVQDMTGPIARDAPMFTDFRQKVVTVPALRPGDTLEVHVVWNTMTPVAPGNFWYQSEFAKTGIVLDERLELDVPSGKYVNVKSAPGVTPSVTEAKGRTVHRWRHASLEVLSDSAIAALNAKREPPSVQITTFRTWEDVAQWYARLIRDREAPTEPMRAAAARLVRGRGTLRDSLAAIYDFVARDYRYV